jgi:predicted nucleic acid-binding protein
MIVVDTCIITHLFNTTELTALAQQVLEINPDWHTPTTWREEYANVLAKLYKKSNCMPQDVLSLFQTTCEALQNRQHRIDTKDALISAMQFQISVYDAHFVVLAEQLSTWLITEDIEVLKKCPKHAVSMRDYVTM